MSIPFTVTAFMCVYNEADILSWVLHHLWLQCVDVHVIDNWSTDGSAVIAREHPAVIGCECFPAEGDSGRYEWRRLLTRVEELAAASPASWCVHHDADEIRRSARPGETLCHALQHADWQGYNAVDHRVLCFHPTDDLYVGDPEKHFRCYSEDGVDNRLPHIKAWKNMGRVSLASSAGHQAEFAGRKVSPEKLLLKHYPIRTAAQGARKVLAERMPRFDPAERAMSWHVQYDELAKTQEWLKDSARLAEWAA